MVADSPKYTVTKVGGGDIINEATDPAFNGEDKLAKVYQIQHPLNPRGPMPSGPGPAAGGRRRRNTKTFPRGILRKTTAKIRPTGNPSKAPPTRKRSVKLMMEGGIEKARKTARAKATKTDIGTIRKRLIEKKIISSEKKNIPPAVLRTLYADSVGAGLLS